MPPQPTKVAIVGSGVTGLAAAWLLSLHKDKFDVTVYEKNSYLGGHTNTIDYTRPTSSSSTQPESTPVDTGFIVFNLLTYPNLLKFFHALNVPYQESNMSFSVTRNDGEFEWAGTDLSTVFAQPSNLLSLKFWTMLFDIIRFNSLATDLLHLPQSHPDRSLTIGAFLDKHGYSDSFAQDYLIPMTACIWSTAPDVCWEAFPAETLIRFMHNHCLLQVLNKPLWYTVVNGSRSYVQAIRKNLDDVRLNDPVSSIERETKEGKVKVHIETRTGHKATYDYVIVAAHGDQALKMLKNPTKEEVKVLKHVNFSKNVAILHSDDSIMPKRVAAWTSWNYATEDPERQKQKMSQVSLTYWMNLLQSIDVHKHGNVFVTMNPIKQINPKKIFAMYEYEHPLYTPQLIEAQRVLKTVNAVAKFESHTVFAGAWANYGFHEDGLTAGLRAAKSLGADCPFEITDATHIRPLKEEQAKELSETVLQLCMVLFVWLLRVYDIIQVGTFPLRRTRVAVSNTARGRI